MTNSVLSLMPGGLEWLVILIVFGVPVVLVVLVVRYVLRASRESQRLRLEVGKLADELEQMRKKTKDAEKSDAASLSR